MGKKKNIQTPQESVVVSHIKKFEILPPPHFASGESQIPNKAFSVKRNGKDVIIQSFTSNVPSCIEKNREKSIRERTKLAPHSR